MSCPPGNLSSREPTYIMNYKVISSQSTKLLRGDVLTYKYILSFKKISVFLFPENKIFTQVSGRISGSVIDKRGRLVKAGESYYHYIKCIWRAGFWSKQTRTMSWLAPGPMLHQLLYILNTTFSFLAWCIATSAFKYIQQWQKFLHLLLVNHLLWPKM